MNSTKGLIILVVLIAILIIGQVVYWRQAKAGKAIRFLSSGGLLFLALFCAYGFWASGELNGQKEVAWKTGYAVLGVLSLVGTVYQAAKGN